MSKTALALGSTDEIPVDFEFELSMSDAAVSSEAMPSLDSVNGVESGPDDEDPLPIDVEFEIAMAEATPPANVVGEDLASVPAFSNELAARVASNASRLDPSPLSSRRRALDFAFGPVWAPAGAETTITIRPQCRYRGEKLMATDDSIQPGFGTMIKQVTVGQRVQKPGNAGAGSLTYFFAKEALSDGITFETAHGYEDIAITVQFIAACTFHANLFGTAESES